jgi:ABC-type transporter Mla subunit MlaD
MRKWLPIGIVGLSFLFLLSVYATPPSSYTWTVHLRTAHELQAGDAVEESGRHIGEVISVESRIDSMGTPGVDVLIAVVPDARDRLRERSTFLVTTPPRATRPVLSLIVFDERSPVLPPGSQITGAESEIEVELRKQFAGLESTVREASEELSKIGRSLERTVNSEEARKLEEGIGGFLDTVRRTRDDVTRVVMEELARLRKLYEKIFPPEREETV